MVTGQRLVADSEQVELRCTKINSEIFSLHRAETCLIDAGLDFMSSLHLWKQQNRISRSELPMSLRFGLGRRSQYSWTDAFCLGFPWGAVLTGVGSPVRCQGFTFHTLQKKNQPDEGKSQCLAISNIFERDAHCVTAEQSS